MTPQQISYQVVRIKNGLLLKAKGTPKTTVLITKDPKHQTHTEEGIKYYYRRVDFNEPGKPVHLGTMECYSDDSAPYFTWRYKHDRHAVHCDGKCGFNLLYEQGKPLHAGKSWVHGWLIINDFTGRTADQLKGKMPRQLVGQTLRFDPRPYLNR